VRADVIHHRQKRRASAERILGRAIAPGFHFIVREMWKDHRSGKELMSRHVVGQRDRQVDDYARHGMHLCFVPLHLSAGSKLLP
jgi:hypothetical protein